jgi:hypothetical protein
MEFYRFNAKDEDNCIRIRASVSYKTLQLIGDDSLLIENNVFSIAEGNKLFDILQFIDSSNFAISSKIKELLEFNKVTGWSCFPIFITGIEEQYYVFQNKGKAGPILNLAEINNYKTVFREFDINTWDRSDIFNLERTLVNACTSRVKSILELANVTNIEILPL